MVTSKVRPSLKLATTLWVATDKFVNGPTVAWPAPFRATFEASVVAVVVSVKVTLPVGVPAPDVTVAVKVTACRKLEGFWLLPTVQLVGAGHCNWNVSVQPPANCPVPAGGPNWLCDWTNNFHVPFGFVPGGKIDAKVAVPSGAANGGLAGAGAGKIGCCEKRVRI